MAIGAVPETDPCTHRLPQCVMSAEVALNSQSAMSPRKWER